MVRAVPATIGATSLARWKKRTRQRRWGTSTTPEHWAARSAEPSEAAQACRSSSPKAGSRPPPTKSASLTSTPRCAKCSHAAPRASTCAATSTGRCWTTSSEHSDTHRPSVWPRSTVSRLREAQGQVLRGLGLWRARAPSAAFRSPCDGTHQVRVYFRQPFGRKQPIHLLLHVTELGVAKALDRTCIHQRSHHAAVGLEQTGRA